jgi:hypothetical protein
MTSPTQINKWLPTVNLRYVRRSVPITTSSVTTVIHGPLPEPPKPVLQQCWNNLETGDFEWRDIPECFE